jgi:aryl-alcohol dehydrogenase-like predicted oxidoreductase
MTKTLNSNQFVLGGDLKINRLGFGAMRVTGPGVWDYPKDVKGAINLLKKVVDMGVNFIDTADSYGPEVSENLIKEALYPYPKDLVIATKGGLTRPNAQRWEPVGRAEYIMQCVEISLRRLKVDQIDLYQLHAIDPQVPLQETLGALKQMQKQGKIRHIGLSNFSVREIEQAKEIIKPVSIQNLYNLANRRSEDVLMYCEKHNMGFIPWYPIGDGQLVKGAIAKMAEKKGVTPAQLALAWLLKRSPVMIPIPGTSSLDHFKENMGTLQVELTDTEFNELESLY